MTLTFEQLPIHSRFRRSGLCSSDEIGLTALRMEGAMRPVEAVLCGLAISGAMAALLRIMSTLLAL